MERIIEAADGRMIQAKLVNYSVLARRFDGKPLTDADWSRVFECFRCLPIPDASPIPASPSPDQGSDQSNPSNPLTCPNCSTESTPAWRRGGKIIERAWPNGRTEMACHFCGQAFSAEKDE